MALALKNRTQETTATTGTGTITLAGAVTGFQSFASVGNGNTTYYCITSGSAWEVGLGTYSTTGPTLARTTIYANSLGTTAAISLTGTSNVFITLPAEFAAGVTSFNGGTTGLTPSSSTTGDITLAGTLAVANGGTGVTTSTGSGNNVLSTSPTIATPTITSLYGQNTNLVTTPYNGSGLIPGELIYRLNATYLGSATTAAQSFLGVGVTLDASTVYQFEALLAMSKTATATAHSISALFGGTATLNNISYEIFLPSGAITSYTDINNATAFSLFIQTASATIISNPGAVASIFRYYLIKGTVSINAGGTFIPQYKTSVSVGPYTTAIGSYFKLSPLGASGSDTNIGSWA